MVTERPQTIQIFLPHGNPTGIKIADLTNRMIVATLIPRKNFPRQVQMVGLNGKIKLVKKLICFIVLKFRNYFRNNNIFVGERLSPKGIYSL